MSMTTLRDAETKIRKLEQELTGLKSQFSQLKFEIEKSNATGNSNTPVSENQKTVQLNVATHQMLDSELTGDQNTIIHKLIHIFKSLKVETFQATDISVSNSIIVGNDLNVADVITGKRLNLLNGGDLQQIHLSHDATVSGFYVQTLGATTMVMSGCYHNGAAFIATDTAANILRFHESAGFIFEFSTGLTVGSSFTPFRLGLWNAGGLTLSPLAVNSFLVTNGASAIAAENAATHRTNLDVYSKAEVNTLLLSKANSGSYPLVLAGVLGHTHVGAVVIDGAHNHTGTVTI